MRKMMMILMVLIVSMTSSLFAKSFAVLTDDESVAYYSKNYKVENDDIKGLFKDCVADFAKDKWKNFTQIIVFDKTGCIYSILLYTEDLKHINIAVTYYNENLDVELKVYHCDTTKETDPLQVGLNFIDRKVVQVYSVDDEKLIYNTYVIEEQ